MSTTEEHKKRPPPIHIPANEPPRCTPGPNAFALAAKAKQEEANKQSAETASREPPTEEVVDHQADPQTRTTTSSHGSVMTTFTNIMMELGMSPRKSDARSSTATSRHGSTARSRHSTRSGHSAASGLQLPPADDSDLTLRSFVNNGEAHYMYKVEEETDRTVRADVEDRAEQKYFKLIGQHPAEERPDDHIEQAGRYAEVDDNKKTEAPKSPKKKIFGMSIPTFGKSTVSVSPAPAMPSKAAEILGATRLTSSPAPAKRRDMPSLPWRPPPRSETSKSLPALYDNESQSGRQKHQHSIPSRNPSSPRKSKASGSSQQGSNWNTQPSVNQDAPRRSPSKATHSKKKHSVQLSDNSIPVLNLGSSADPVPSNGKPSPTKFRPYQAEEYAKLVEAPQVLSSRAEVFAGAVELEGDVPENVTKQKDTESPTAYPEWWLNERAKGFPNAQNDLPALPPAFYSPADFARSLFEDGHPSHNTDKNRFLFNIDPRRDVSSSQRSATSLLVHCDFEPDPTAITADMPGSTPQAQPLGPDTGPPTRAGRPDPQQDAGSSRVAQTTGVTQPAERSSKLTDILENVSPSKTGYNYDFQAHNPSAVPSPLNNGQQFDPLSVPGQPPAWSGQLPDGSNILNHFFQCHSHMDVLGRTLYDMVEDSTKDAREASKSITDNQDAMLATLEQRFEDLKADITAVGRASERASEGSQAVILKVDGLVESIRNEFMERLNKQAQKTSDLSSSIKALQNAVQELQRTVDKRAAPYDSAPPGVSHPLPPMQPPNPFNHHLPQHRSQPSLAGYPENTSNGLPPGVNEMRNEVRYPNYNYSGVQNQQWGRPGTAGRDGRDENSGFPSSNAYYHGSPAQGRNAFMGQGYNNGFYTDSGDEHSYGYSQMAK
ncbi:hypothetical protein M011DRAFT_473773 [Sporormia fimetaria CBS 119925]|uniref:Uncharacterized protein n=1 Tax=Sporormia fimetaria CBS 119925 TaxID=1340428 RepID=A0A6A6VKX0_9PLEO|nr:hypothetical protein M011DRAFT_473773 [Sporormia fimetaria CBS 119925]